MDSRLLDYYNQELVYMRELAGEFAQAHPRIARRLGMQAGDVADPYVERLIESFCFMAARMQIKLDAEFPRFTARLLEVLYPNYVAPTPSMAVARFFPGHKEGDSAEGFRVPRGSTFTSRLAHGENTACRFQNGQEVMLYPLEIVEARLTDIPQNMPALARYVPASTEVRGALRLRLRTVNGMDIAGLRGLDRLPIYLTGDEQIASHVFELLHTASVVSITGAPGEFESAGAGGMLSVVSGDAVAHEGLGPAQGLLPLAWSRFHGHNLLQEYFACPGRFYFFTLTGLDAGFRRVKGQEVEIVVLLERAPGRLVNLVDASCFALFCTPLINLFSMRMDSIALSGAQTEFRVIPDRTAPLDYEVFCVESLKGQTCAESGEFEFRPLYQSLNNDEGNYGRYFSTRRERRLISDSARRHGTRTQYIGTEVYVSLVDQHDAPYREELRYLSVAALATNRDLSSLVPRNGINDLELAGSGPFASIGLVRAPTAPKAPYAEREMAWRLIRQLNFNYLPLDDLDHRAGGQGLRDLLRLFLTDDATDHRRQAESLVGVKTRPVTRKLPGSGVLVFGRGVECVLTVDETGFSGTSPYLFGLILEHFLARHASINAFTQTELHSMQRGCVARWPVRMGTRGAA